jgi:hypothetical protein
MTSFGRIQVSGFTAAPELTQALANINFDFAIVKVQPPAEFHDLGVSLTPARRQKAEDGSLHLTARRLAAMFEPVLPETPELLRCYGLRASEIATASTKNEKTKLSTATFGLLSGQAGVDGTSIWAGATSGRGAIQVHLLACMLARMWDGPEATSIWVELLRSRREQVQNSFEASNSMDVRSMMAMQQQVDRAQLAEWDASARAWLRIADSAKTLQQKQLLLIIGNMSKFVNSKPVLYDSVMNAWRAGLGGMEKLLNGSPLQMQSGEILLALSSWHLYPDLNVLDSATKIVRQKDPLVPESGILTIGLQHCDVSDTGLRWSLPLAHLRYYGDPVKRTSAIRSEGSRLSLKDYNMAVLGCMLGAWGIEDQDMYSVIEWIADLSKALLSLPSEETQPFRNSWMQVLGETAHLYVKAEGLNRKISSQLLNLGRSRYSYLTGILPAGTRVPPLFGLSNINVAIRLAKGADERVRLLRSHVAKAGFAYKSAIIRYISDKTGLEEFASAVPYERAHEKRTEDGVNKPNMVFRRWIRLAPPVDLTLNDGQSESGQQETAVQDEVTGYESATCNDDAEQEQDIPSQDDNMSSKCGSKSIHEINLGLQKERYEKMGEEVLDANKEPIISIVTLARPMRVTWGHLGLAPHSLIDSYDPWFGEMKHYEKWLGEESTAAVFLKMDLAPPGGEPRISTRELLDLFKNDSVDKAALPSIILQSMDEADERFANALRALATINRLYHPLKQATIDVRVFGEPLEQSKWLKSVRDKEILEQSVKKFQHIKDTDGQSDEELGAFSFEGSNLAQTDCFEEAFDALSEHTLRENQPVKPRAPIISDARSWKPFKLATQTSFSCILLFESNFDIDPSQLKNVIALSNGNSLFIAGALLCDPAEAPWKSRRIQHVMGNVGQAGTALLVPPIGPRIMPLGLDHWHLINHSAWDGQNRDCFADCTLHLWFTGKKQEVDTGYSGAQDTELFILESVVSVHGRGKWVADLDILAALNDRTVVYRYEQEVVSEDKQAASQGNECPPIIRPEGKEVDSSHLNTQDEEHFDLERDFTANTNGDWVSESATRTRPDSPMEASQNNQEAVPSVGQAIVQRHSCPAGHGHEAKYHPYKLPLASVENWTELLDITDKNCIFLAHENWQARLAATMICIAQSRRVYLLSGRLCWACVESARQRETQLKDPVVYIL